MTEKTTTLDSQRLASIVSRIQLLNAEKENILADIREVYTEAKHAGYDVKALRTVIKLAEISTNPKRKNEQDELEYCVEAYKNALNIG